MPGVRKWGQRPFIFSSIGGDYLDEELDGGADHAKAVFS